MTKLGTLSLLLALVGCTAPVGDGPLPVRFAIEEPDPDLTPGVLCTQEDRDYDGDRYPQSIPHCKRNVSRRTKVSVAAQYGVSEDELTGYEIDHFYPLGLGGSNARQNLWPLLYDEARRKARLEDQLYLQLRDGEITQADALDAIRNWRQMIE